MIGPEDSLEFWFGDLPFGHETPAALRARWWKKDPALDAEIEERFGAALLAAAAGELDGWTETLRGTLALIILLDQFTRNTRRDTVAMYANDAQALELTRLFLDLEGAEQLHPDMRMFAVMPLMHSESVLDQERCVAFAERLTAELAAGGPPYAGYLEGFVKYAIVHREIVAQWGRFPHRNKILGRDSTPEEVEFLKTPGSSF